MTAYTRSPSRSASARRLSTRIASPSLMTMPSAPSSNVRQRPRRECARVLLKHRNMNGFWAVSMPPASAMSLLPVSSSLTAR